MEATMSVSGVREEVLNRLVEEHQTALLRLCYLILRDTALAEDAVQETFWKAWQNIMNFRGESSEKTWLTHIAVNTCRDMRRSAWLRHTDRRITPEMLPEAISTYTPRDEIVTIVVLALPDKLREAITLYYYQDMTMQEIADALGIGLSTVHGRIKKAQDKLRQELERRGYHG